VVDLLAEFTQIVPNAVISRLTGVPPGDDEARFRKLSQSVISAFIPFTPPALRQPAEAHFQELAAWVRELVAKRRAHPEEDLVTDLVHAQDADERLSEDDVVLLLAGIVSAGSETIALSGARIIKMLLAHSEVAQRLRADPPLIRRSIEELIRFALDGPGGPMRYALRDFELRGRAIRRGDMLMLSLGGANRDPAVYAEPDRLDLERDVRNLAAFGAGPHFCLGANLARQELGCMTEALLAILPPGSRVREDRLEYQDAGLFVRALNLPVEIAS
jgi:cytochrome P450